MLRVIVPAVPLAIDDAMGAKHPAVRGSVDVVIKLECLRDIEGVGIDIEPDVVHEIIRAGRAVAEVSERVRVLATYLGKFEGGCPIRGCAFSNGIAPGSVHTASAGGTSAKLDVIPVFLQVGKDLRRTGDRESQSETEHPE